MYKRDKGNYNSKQNDFDDINIEYSTTEKYIFLYYESKYEIDQFGRFIRNSSKKYIIIYSMYSW